MQSYSGLLRAPLQGELLDAAVLKLCYTVPFRQGIGLKKKGILRYPEIPFYLWRRRAESNR